MEISQHTNVRKEAKRAQAVIREALEEKIITPKEAEKIQAIRNPIEREAAIEKLNRLTFYVENSEKFIRKSLETKEFTPEEAKGLRAIPDHRERYAAVLKLSQVKFYANPAEKQIKQALEFNNVTPEEAQRIRAIPNAEERWEATRKLSDLNLYATVAERTINKALELGNLTPEEARKIRAIPDAKERQQATEKLEGPNIRPEVAEERILKALELKNVTPEEARRIRAIPNAQERYEATEKLGRLNLHAGIAEDRIQEALGFKHVTPEEARRIRAIANADERYEASKPLDDLNLKTSIEIERQKAAEQVKPTAEKRGLPEPCSEEELYRLTRQREREASPKRMSETMRLYGVEEGGETRTVLTVRFADGREEYFGASWFLNGETAKPGEQLVFGPDALEQINRSHGESRGTGSPVLVQSRQVPKITTLQRLAERYLHVDDIDLAREQPKLPLRGRPQPPSEEELYRLTRQREREASPKRMSETMRLYGVEEGGETRTVLTVRLADGREEYFGASWFLNGETAKPGEQLVFGPNALEQINRSNWESHGTGSPVLVQSRQVPKTTTLQRLAERYRLRTEVNPPESQPKLPGKVRAVK
jgi:hypothetical protein